MKAFPFDSNIIGYDENGAPMYDRASNSEEFARLFASFLSNGVFGSGMCTVLANDGMSVTVGTGYCLINGRYGYIDESESVSIASAHATFTRIDTIVLRLNLTPSVNNIVIAVHAGSPASTPNAPTLTRDGTTWELGLANVIIPPNSAGIIQSNIIDTRLDTARCGIVAAINSTIDTTNLYLQIQSQLAQFYANEQNSFNEWFNAVKDVLGEDAAGNLFLLVNRKSETVTYTGTFDVDGWSNAAPYTQTANVTGILATDNPIVDVVSLSSDAATAKAQLESFGCAGRLTTANGTAQITCYHEKPTASFTIQLKVIR